MSTPYIGEIRMFAGNFAPAGWEFCAGQLLSISENEALFTLIGTTYGGDGQSTFAVPDLRGRLPVHQGNSFVIGQMAGTETVTLSTPQIPSHSHFLMGTNSGSINRSPATRTMITGRVTAYTADNSSLVNMHTSSIASSGGGQPHDNMMPYLCISFIISLYGIYPSPN